MRSSSYTESAYERFALSSGHSAACRARRLLPCGMWVFPQWDPEVGGGRDVGSMCEGELGREESSNQTHMGPLLLAVECGSYSGVYGRGARGTERAHCQGVGSCG